MLEEFIFADVGGDHFLDLALLEQHADAEIVDASIVADDGEVLRAFAPDSSDQVLRDATEPEAAHEDGSAIVELLNGGVRGGDAFVHTVLRSVRGSLLHPALEREAARRAAMKWSTSEAAQELV